MTVTCGRRPPWAGSFPVSRARRARSTSASPSRSAGVRGSGVPSVAGAGAASGDSAVRRTAAASRSNQPRASNPWPQAGASPASTARITATWSADTADSATAAAVTGNAAGTSWPVTDRPGSTSRAAASRARAAARVTFWVQRSSSTSVP
nr:hypothetical protein [Pseudonocardia sp. H11422]